MVISAAVVSMGGPDSGGGCTAILYIRSVGAFGDGVHSMVTIELAVPFTMLLSITLLWGSSPVTMHHN